MDEVQKAPELLDAIKMHVDEDAGKGQYLLTGVTIGEGSVIGAGSVVTKDVPPHVIAVGNPCRVLRSLR